MPVDNNSCTYLELIKSLSSFQILVRVQEEQGASLRHDVSLAEVSARGDLQMQSLVRLFAIGCVSTIVFAGTTQAQAEDAKWFVLRQEATSFCWTGLLIAVNGEYAHSFATLAGGPFDTKQEALDHEKELEQVGSCVHSS
jgi:hypothetical protein